MSVKVGLLAVIFCVAGLCQAQTVTSAAQTMRIKGEEARGYGVNLEGKKDDISSAWGKFVKDLGKNRSGGDFITITEVVLNGTAYTKGTLYVKTEGNDQKATAWIGLKETEWNEGDVNGVQKELEKVAYRFGVKYYRDKIQVQIDEAQRALDATEKQQQRLVGQNKDLTLRLSNNDQERVALEKSLENNKLENAALNVRLENNKKSQDSVAQAATRIKEVLNSHKERQRKVN
jgi:hypothetical protein